MTDLRPDQERDLLAAEYALRLLEGEELASAERLILADLGFRAQVEAWQTKLAPLADEIREENPSPEVWDRIERWVAGAPVGGAVVSLNRKLKVWRAYAAGATAIAASLALLVAFETSRDAPGPATPRQGQVAPMLVATVSSETAETSLAIAYDQAGRSLLVTPGRLQQAAGQDHELWIIPEGGTPISLGLVRGSTPARHMVPAEVAPHFRARAAVALSVEPQGGSPTGQPTGPVIAAGELITI